MRRTCVVCMLLAVLFASGTVGGDSRSPWPDLEERAAFQQQELERRMNVCEHLKRPASSGNEEQDRYDVTYYKLNLDFRELYTPWMRGEIEVQLTVTDELDTFIFDLNEVMHVDSVKMGGMTVSFTHRNYELKVFPPGLPEVGESYSITIFYQGEPDNEARAFAWDRHGDTPLIWTLSEPVGAREWWPCKDWPHDKADSVDVILRVVDWMTATSNGLLVSNTDEGDGSRTFHWKHRYPISTYLVSVTATEYARIEDEYVSPDGKRMLLEHFVYPEQVTQAEEDFSITAEAIDVMAEAFGPYPFLNEKYGHSVFPWGGGMEHQTNTSYGSMLITGGHVYDWLLIHELGHQWWGDMTSPAEWKDIWLNEGFASWSEALWFEYVGGPEDYRAYMNNVQMVVDPSGPLYDPARLFDPNTVYNKGAWAVHMLRGVLGDSLFYAFLAEYRERTEFRSTTTAEFQEILEEVAEEDMDWFMDPWIYGVDRPLYEVSFLPFGDPVVPSVAVHIGQTQDSGIYFSMPIDLVLKGSHGADTVRVWNDPDHEDFEFDVKTVTTEVIVDPHSWILKQVDTAPYVMNITTTDIPDGVQDSSYSAVLVGRGGTEPYRWDVSDPLPAGMELDTWTGELHGTAPAEGDYQFTINLRDNAYNIDTQLLRWAVAASADTTSPPPDTTVIGPTDRIDMKVGPIPAHTFASFSIAKPVGAQVTLDVYDVHGRMVRRLWNGGLPSRNITWDGRDERGEKITSGIYIAYCECGGRTTTHRIVWIWGR